MSPEPLTEASQGGSLGPSGSATNPQNHRHADAGPRGRGGPGPLDCKHHLAPARRCDCQPERPLQPERAREEVEEVDEGRSGPQALCVSSAGAFGSYTDALGVPRARSVEGPIRTEGGPRSSTWRYHCPTISFAWPEAGTCRVTSGVHEDISPAGCWDVVVVGESLWPVPWRPRGQGLTRLPQRSVRSKLKKWPWPPRTVGALASIPRGTCDHPVTHARCPRDGKRFCIFLPRRQREVVVLGVSLGPPNRVSPLQSILRLAPLDRGGSRTHPRWHLRSWLTDVWRQRGTCGQVIRMLPS